jgi:predicted secreted protein
MKFIYILFIFVLISCSNQQKGIKNFTNKKVYKLKVGETFEIYYSTNSCCYFCLSNTNQSIVNQISNKRIKDNLDETCAGCDALYSLKFKAVKKGEAYIYTKIVPASKACSDSTLNEYTKYQIIVEE